jgi:hypothetical protein
MNKRILFSDNGTISDWTMALNNYNGASKTIDFVAGEDALLIGSKLPFNSLYFKLKELNVISSEVSIEYYSNGWNSAVEVTDETNGFTQSGHITFVPNKNSTWSMKPDSTEIAELSSVIIYDQYWLKITFGTTITATTAIQWVGSLFSNDEDLAAEFPDLVKSDVLYSYKANKVDWQEQHVKTAEIIEHDLINKGIIDGSENILARDWYRNAAVQKTAEIIFSAFGDDYADQRLRAREEYGLRLVKRLARVDKNNNAKEEVAETRNVSGFLSR